MGLNLVKFVIRFHQDEAGQGLVEYVLIFSLIALSTVAGMSTLASALNSGFVKVGTIVGQYIS